MRDKKHLVEHSNKLMEKAKEKALFRTQRKAVEAGAHGTLNYTIKKGANKNKIDPGKPLDDDLYALPENKVKKIPTVCGSLREAMESLDRDRDFLKQDSVFTDDQIDAYIALKFEEIHKLEHTPHPIEFEMYYSC